MGFKICIRAVITAAGMMATVYGVGTANYCVGAIGLIVAVAGVFALEELANKR